MIEASLSLAARPRRHQRRRERRRAVSAASRSCPAVTLKNRLPTPSARLQSSVISQPIVCEPLVSVDQSKMEVAARRGGIGEAREGAGDVRAHVAVDHRLQRTRVDRHLHARRLDLAGRGAVDLRRQPPAEVGAGARSPPIAGVSIDPNGLVAVLLLMTTVLVPIVAVLPS